MPKMPEGYYILYNALRHLNDRIMSEQISEEDWPAELAALEEANRIIGRKLREVAGLPPLTEKRLRNRKRQR